MKLVLSFFLFVLFLSSCQKQESFSWLEGDWIRLNDPEDGVTYEKWVVDNGVYTGVGFTMSEGDTISKELMTIQKLDENWSLEVRVADEPMVAFDLTNNAANSFTFENQEIEFPKVINYVLENDTLKAVISNDEMSVDFIFVKE